MGWRDEASKAKRLHRPSLKDWTRDGLYHTFAAYESSICSNEERYCSFTLQEEEVHDVRWRDSARPTKGDTPMMIPVVLDANQTPPEHFHSEYEAKGIPVVLRDIPYGHPDGDTHHPPWPAIHSWTFPSLYKDPNLRSRSFKVGEDDDGYTVKMKLRHFLRYLEHNTDDSPLYIFDATFDEDRVSKRLLRDYTVPTYFHEDLFQLVGETRRPPYRWFLVGPQRSGTTVHIDPLGTSAWNTLIVGVKRWVLFPPHVPKSIVKGRKEILKGEDDEAVHYFTTILPRIKRRAVHVLESGTIQGSGYEHFQCFEFTQWAGETVFIPHGWWHAVLNVTHTVGITQNYCSRRNFDAVWVQTRSGRKKMACTWLRRLQDQYPDLALRARELNRRDQFVMWEDDPVEQRKWMKKKAEKERKKKEKESKRQSREKEEDSSTERKKRLSKKEKWGEHRTTDRRNETVSIDCNNDVVGSRVVSPH